MAWVDYKSDSKAEVGMSGSPFDSSGFVVNFGSGSVSQVGGAQMPTWVLWAAAAGAAWWLWKHQRS